MRGLEENQGDIGRMDREELEKIPSQGKEETKSAGEEHVPMKKRSLKVERQSD